MFVVVELGADLTVPGLSTQGPIRASQSCNRLSKRPAVVPEIKTYNAFMGSFSTEDADTSVVGVNSREAASSPNETQTFIEGLWGVRYQVKDVRRAVAFYTQQLGFKLDLQNLPAFAQVSIGNLKLILSGPGASGSRPMPDGRTQEPGGWNRVILRVVNLQDRIEGVQETGLAFPHNGFLETCWATAFLQPALRPILQLLSIRL